MLFAFPFSGMPWNAAEFYNGRVIRKYLYFVMQPQNDSGDLMSSNWIAVSMDRLSVSMMNKWAGENSSSSEVPKPRASTSNIELI